MVLCESALASAPASTSLAGFSAGLLGLLQLAAALTGADIPVPLLSAVTATLLAAQADAAAQLLLELLLLPLQLPGSLIKRSPGIPGKGNLSLKGSQRWRPLLPPGLLLSDPCSSMLLVAPLQELVRHVCQGVLDQVCWCR